MNKLTVAATLAITLTSSSILPSLAVAQECIRGQCREVQSEPYCGDQLGILKRVYPAEVLGVDDGHRVWVTEVCVGHTLMRSDGNAAYLRTTIAKNDVLTGVLADHGFHADDVLLCLAPPVGLSARNALPCEVRALDRVGHEVLALLRVGDSELRARLTPAAARELGLAPGMRAVAVVKTAAVHHLG